MFQKLVITHMRAVLIKRLKDPERLACHGKIIIRQITSLLQSDEIRNPLDEN